MAKQRQQAIADYYDANTTRFLAIGGSGRALAIHRGLWPPGIHNAEDAAAEINRRIEATLAGLDVPAPTSVIDLGCGVGGTMFQLAAVWPEAAFEGVTISARQIRIARDAAARRGLAERCRFRQADFASTGLTEAELVIAIESHVYADSAGAFLTAAARITAAKGHLVIVDDMLSTTESMLSARDRHRIARLRVGWRLGHVPAVDELRAAAGAAGFTVAADHDLTPLLRLNRWRDTVLRVVAPIASGFGLARWPLFANMIGGNALNAAYRSRALCYRMMVLRRAVG